MLYILTAAAVVFFIAHVVLLLLSFKGADLLGGRYFYSHLTLWITGLLVFLLATLYSGSGTSGFLDYFDTATKRIYILLFTFGLSLVAHCIVKFAVLPLIRSNRA